MNKIVFISDFFYPEINGGAEIYDEVLINELKKKKFHVSKFSSSEFTIKHVELYNKMNFKFLISNFAGLKKDVIQKLYFDKCDYCILEHDHKYLSNRNPSVFKNYLAPDNMIINKDFYLNAKYVFCQSKKHKEVLKNNLKCENTLNLGCSLWSEEQIQAIKKSLKKEKTEKCFILGDKNKIKGLNESISFCESKNLEYKVVEKRPYDEFLEELSKYEKLVFFPKTLESFCRLVLEARMLNCSLATNDLNGCTSEDWFKKLKGKELIEFVDSQRNKIVNKIINSILEKKEDDEVKDITVILNCYRRPYNLELQIKAIKEQTIKPKQIWVWVNKHEDNENFDLESLGVDRIFNNDYNWKFYGRFAAALLADTEYIAIYDDDTIPGEKWHQNCINTMKTNEGILGSAGIILKSDKYVNHDRCGWPTQNEETTEVDLVGHAWFFRREWLRYLWQEKPTTWDNGEDIQFAFMAKIYGNIKTYCPPHPSSDKSLHGSILGNELGIDDKATSTNSSVSHKQFFSERDFCVQTGIKKGWKTVRGVKL